MADDDPYLSYNAAEVAVGSDTLLQALKPKIQKAVQCKVDTILQDLHKFSDNDKLYLYLQLPVGLSAAEKSSLDVNSLSTAEHTQACTWIRHHLEEHTDTCLPKQDVYDTYKRYCDKLCCRPLSAANFGKIIREIFPNIKARRLGGRGQSKYCYSGIRRRTVVSMPTLPSLDMKTTDSSEVMDVVQTYSSEVIEASCALICNWAEKILKRSFNDVVEVAQFLIQQHIISPRCASAELVMSMVVSAITENAQRSQKQPAHGSKNDVLENPEGTAESQKPEDKTVKASTPHKPADKKSSDAEKSAYAPHVDALMARLPPLRPRITSAEPTVGCCTILQCSAPILGPRLPVAPLMNSLQVAARPLIASTASPAAPLTMPGVNGPGVVSLQKAVPVINVILPKVTAGVALPVSEIQCHPTRASGEVGRTGQSDETPSHPPGVQKRPLDLTKPPEAANETAYKKKRGRPRKVTCDAATGASSPPSDSETSSRVLPEAPKCHTVAAEDSTEQTAEVAERQEKQSVLKMVQPRAGPACAAQASRGKDSLREEMESRSRSEAVELERDQNSGDLSSGNCQAMHSPPSGEGERSAPHPSHSEHIADSRGSMADGEQNTPITEVSDRTKRDTPIDNKEDWGPTSQVSVIQDGRHSMQRYILGLAQEGESGKLRRVLGQKAVERNPSPGGVSLAAEQARDTEGVDIAQKDPSAEPRARDPSAVLSTSVLSWGATTSKSPGDAHGGFLHQSQTGH